MKVVVVREMEYMKRYRGVKTRVKGVGATDGEKKRSLIMYSWMIGVRDGDGRTRISMAYVPLIRTVIPRTRCKKDVR